MHFKSLHFHFISFIYLTNLCVPVTTNTSRRYLRSATPMDHEVLLFQVLLSGTLCHRPYTCIDHYTRTVSEWTKDNTVSFGLWDMTRRFRDCLGH